MQRVEGDFKEGITTVYLVHSQEAEKEISSI